MKKRYPIATATSLLALFSSVVFAHPGHDHSAESANLIHLLWAAPVLLAAIVTYKWLKANSAKKSSLDEHL